MVFKESRKLYRTRHDTVRVTTDVYTTQRHQRNHRAQYARMCSNAAGPVADTALSECAQTKDRFWTIPLARPGSSHSERQAGVLGAGSEGKRWGVKEEVRSFRFAKWKTPGGWLGEQNTIELYNINGFKMVNFMLHYFGTIKTKNNEKSWPFSSLFLSLFPFT